MASDASTGPQHPSALFRSFERMFPSMQEELRYLRRIAETGKRIEPRRRLVREGQSCRNVFLVKSGWLAEFKLLEDGRRQILNFCLPGDIVAIMCLAYGEVLHSAVTLTRCEVVPLLPNDFEQVQREYPRLATLLFLTTLRDGAILQEWEVSLGRRSALSSIAHLFLELHRRLSMRGLAADDGSIVPFPLTQADIADCTGLSVPYVNRTLQQMRKRGLISLREQKLKILEPTELAKAADFVPEYVENWGRGWIGQGLRGSEPAS